MIRAQRKLHAILWQLLALVLCAVIGAAMVARTHVRAVVDAAPHARPY